ALWDLNDVSILLPLPRAAAEDSLLWGPATEGGQGPLLPAGLYKILPRISSDLDAPTLYAKSLKVVAIRLDPCFHEGAPARVCQRQVRVVMQPLVFEGGQWTTLDAALHVFYVFSDREWLELVAKLRPPEGRSFTVGLPLQAHPVISREGLRGPAWKNLSAALLPFLGARKIARATAMSVNPLGNFWFFSGINVNNGQWSRLKIPRVPEETQGFFTDPGAMGQDVIRAAMNPSPEGEPGIKRLLFNSVKARQEMTADELQSATREALHLLNPRRHNSGTADCVSCHVAPTVSFWSARQFPTWNWNRLFAKDMPQARGNQANTTVRPGRAQVLRAFGYFDSDPIISPRTVNESLEVLRQMPR
ncbi:MAG: hypothetical protein KF865_12875, partial [Bdellovibrionaceae bacterium]|nr:hypothetical protein [Pseudobdellovibrionaceae bacterium]